MGTVKLLLEYEGTTFFGWQRQIEYLTVQQVLEDALGTVLGKRVPVVSAGRTDRGVHALGQVAVFRAESPVPTERYPFALNSHLPPSVRVLAAEEAAPDFHPCRDATAKHYRYTLWRGAFAPALWRNCCTTVGHTLDVPAMRKAAACMEGRRDFRAFRSASKGQEHLSTVKEVTRVLLRTLGPWLLVDVLGSGFLYTQVRTMVGTLNEVGRGNIPPSRIEEILVSEDRTQAGPTSPPQGLCLMQVFYGAVPPAWHTVPGPAVWLLETDAPDRKGP